MLSQIYASIGSFLPQPMKQRSLNYQNMLQLLWKIFLCRLFFQMIEINYVPIYMKINHIFFVIKGQFPVTDYIQIQIQIQILYSLRITTCNQHEVHNLTRLFCYNNTKWLIDLGREKVSFKNIEFSSILRRTFFH